ncbi:bactofilin family protein [Natronospora cellulosivora (SeqCode)]
MLGKRKNDKKVEEAKGKVETILGTGTSMDGDINTRGSLRVEGTINKGNINAEGDVLIGENGQVNTTIDARNVVIAGKVNGNINARDKIEILPTGSLNGDIKSKVLKIDEGAVFNGVSNIISENKEESNSNNKAYIKDKYIKKDNDETVK